MSNLDPRIEAVRAKYDLATTDFWKIPQNGQWVCKHAALEIVATKANVEWEAPQIIQADTGNGIAVLAVTGRMGGRVEWSTGEASPKNNKNAYPWAMAEKRAKDRVILKLAGIHGLVYSEDEIDEPRTTDQRSEQGRREVANQAGRAPASKPAKTKQETDMENLWAELVELQSAEGLKSFWADNSKAIAGFDDVNRARFTKKKDELKASFETDRTVADIQDTFPGAKVVDVRRTEETFPGDLPFDDEELRRHPMNAG